MRTKWMKDVELRLGRLEVNQYVPTITMADIKECETRLANLRAQLSNADDLVLRAEEAAEAITSAAIARNEATAGQIGALSARTAAYDRVFKELGVLINSRLNGSSTS